MDRDTGHGPSMATDAAEPTVAPRVALVIEQDLGHRTHSDTLRHLVPRDPRIRPVFIPIEFPIEGGQGRVPGLRSNETIATGLRARAAIRAMHRASHLDAMFIHTQTPAILTGRWMHKIPTVVSLDATPVQYDSLGEFYGHDTGGRAVERVKKGIVSACFRRARHLVTWSEWARKSLIDDYGVPAAKVTTIPPGVLPELWHPQTNTRQPGETVRLLFVGGDFARKGGPELIQALRGVNERAAGSIRAELHIVTNAEVSSAPGVTVHPGLGPNQPELVELYRNSDIFVLPTKADASGMVLMEAAAAGLPTICTNVGGTAEIVRHERTGLIVDLQDARGLRQALERLVDRPEERARMGAAAREFAMSDLDARANALRLVGILREVAMYGRVR